MVHACRIGHRLDWTLPQWTFPLTQFQHLLKLGKMHENSLKQYSFLWNTEESLTPLFEKHVLEILFFKLKCTCFYLVNKTSAC